ncbi:hypothetical protein [Pseudoxanthomonas putridarboris]
MLLVMLLLPLAACVSVRGAWSLHAIHKGIHQSGRVQQVGELPCFAVADSDEAMRAPPELRSLDVFEIVDGPDKSIWEWSFSRNPPVSLAPDDCIAYGSNNGRGEERLGSAPLLRPGVTYGFRFNSIIRFGNDENDYGNREYFGEFCLSLDSVGKFQVHDLRRDKSGAEMCGIEYGR